MAISTHNWAVGEVVTAANMNTYLRDNIADLESRKVVIKTGTYTGDTGTTQAVTGVGFEPIYLKIWEAPASGNGSNMAETTDSYVDNDADGLAQYTNHDATENKAQNDIIRSLDADGFTVGDQGGLQGFNSNGIIYEYMALKSGSTR